MDREMAHFITRIQILEGNLVIYTMKFTRMSAEYRIYEANIQSVLESLDSGTNIAELKHLLGYKSMHHTNSDDENQHQTQDNT